MTNLCDSWVALGYATAQANCNYQLTPAKANLTGAAMWPKLVPTSNMMFTFSVTTSNASPVPGEGFARVIGDPSLSATPKGLGSGGLGLGANGIPGFATTFNIDGVVGGPTTPFLGNTFNESGLWANPWIDTNTSLVPLAAPGITTTHNFIVNILNDALNITMDWPTGLPWRCAAASGGVYLLHGGQRSQLWTADGQQPDGHCGDAVAGVVTLRG